MENSIIKFETPLGTVKVTKIEKGSRVQLSCANEDWFKLDILHPSMRKVSLPEQYPGWVMIESYDELFKGAYYKIID